MVLCKECLVLAAKECCLVDVQRVEKNLAPKFMLAKKFRIKFKKDFDNILKSRNKFFSNNFSIKFYPNYQDISKFSIVVSTKISKKATVRNQLRRRIFEILRLKMPNIKSGYSVMIFAKQGAILLDYENLEQEIFYLLNKSRLLKYEKDTLKDYKNLSKNHIS